MLETHPFVLLFYATNHLRSTVVAVRGGLVQMRRGYQPFGEVGWGEGDELGHQFTGERHDPTGLYALGPRHYDPTTGRFLQPDPIVPGAENPQALNRYSYVLNRPLELTDPSGFEPESSSSQGRRPSIGPGFFSNEPGIIGRIPGFEQIGLLFRLLSGEFPRGGSISERRLQSVPPSQSDVQQRSPSELAAIAIFENREVVFGQIPLRDLGGFAELRVTIAEIRGRQEASEVRARLRLALSTLNAGRTAIVVSTSSSVLAVLNPARTVSQLARDLPTALGGPEGALAREGAGLFMEGLEELTDIVRQPIGPPIRRR